MKGAESGLLTMLVGPAIVAAVITFILNTRDERKRTLRDHLTRSFDEVRGDIRGAVSAGVAYFGCNVPKELPKLEAQVLLFESDVRSGMAAIRAACSTDEMDAIPGLIELEGEFLDALTGGQFGSAKPLDPARVRQIIGLGSRLRSALGKLRRHQLAQTQSKLMRGNGLLIVFLVTFAIAYGAGFYAGYLIK